MKQSEKGIVTRFEGLLLILIYEAPVLLFSYLWWEMEIKSPALIGLALIISSLDYLWLVYFFANRIRRYDNILTRKCMLDSTFMYKQSNEMWSNTIGWSTMLIEIFLFLSVLVNFFIAGIAMIFQMIALVIGCFSVELLCNKTKKE